jgi:hypothetical protein
MPDLPPGQAERKFLTQALEFELKAAESVDKELRWGQWALGVLCVLGAFGLAFVLVLAGPPSPETASKAQYSQSMPSATGEATATPVGELALLTNDTSTGTTDPPPPSEEVQEDSPPTSPEGDSPGDATEDSGAPEESEEDGDETATAVLDEQAPWVFAIVALLVGAFLAAGQSISFGGGKEKAGTDDQPDSPTDDDDTGADDDDPVTPDSPPAEDDPVQTNVAK